MTRKIDSTNYSAISSKKKSIAEYIDGTQAEVDWTGKDEDTQYFTHGFHPYPARMPPHISRHLLRIYSKSKEDLILDPYCGSGGVLVESMLFERQSVGVDLNPLAVLIAKVKTTPLDAGALTNARAELLLRINKQLNKEEEIIPPDMPNITFWFKPEAVHGLTVIKEGLNDLRSDKDLYDFFQVCFSLTVRRSSNIKNGEFKLYGKQGIEKERFQPKPLEVFSKITRDNISRMKEFSTEMAQHPNVNATVLEGDTRKILSLNPDVVKEGSVKMVITSPPYGDSHTTVAYGQFSKYSSLWLGLPPDDVLLVDKRGLGGEMVKKRRDLGSPKLDAILSTIAKTDEKRSREVYSFFYDADVCLEQIVKSLKKNESHCCYVVANRTVRRVPILTDEIFVEMGKKYGLEHLKTLYREIPSKHMPLVNAPENIPGKQGFTMTKESIVIWKY